MYTVKQYGETVKMTKVKDEWEWSNIAACQSSAGHLLLVFVCVTSMACKRKKVNYFLYSS